MWAKATSSSARRLGAVGIQQVSRTAAERAGQLVDGRQTRLTVTVLQLGEDTRGAVRPPGPSAPGSVPAWRR